MNDTATNMRHRNVDPETVHARYAARISACLSEQAQTAGHDVSERLRFARERALAHARERRAVAPVPVHTVGHGNVGALALGGGPRPASPWWSKVASVLPLLALLGGLLMIQHQHSRDQITAAAEIDFDLLVDEVPPTAYSDRGFLEYLKAPRD